MVSFRLLNDDSRLLFQFVLFLLISYSCQYKTIPDKENTDVSDWKHIKKQVKFINPHKFNLAGGFTNLKRVGLSDYKFLDFKFIKSNKDSVLNYWLSQNPVYFYGLNTVKRVKLLTIVRRGMYGLDMDLYIYNQEGKLINKVEQLCKFGGDMQVQWERIAFLKGSTYTQIEYVYKLDERITAKKQTWMREFVIDKSGHCKIFEEKGKPIKL